MEIQIIQKQCGGTEFFARPHRLHLGAQNAAGVDTLQFTLPEAWAGCTAALYLRRSDGTLMAPVPLDENNCVPVDRKLTGSTGGQWMLAAVTDAGYTAYTRPGSYDTYAILPTDGGTEELPPSLYEQFVARVLESSRSASSAAQKAALSASSTAVNAADAQTAAQRTSSDSASAAKAAARAEAAAARAEALAPEGGQVLSVNGKAGVVSLTAQDVNALPCPAKPAAGQLLRVLSVDPGTGAILTDTVSQPDLSPYVLSSTVPTSAAAGAVKVNASYGINVRSDGTLTTVPATKSQLNAMTAASAPLTPALLPYGVKKALTTAAGSAGWTAAEKTSALLTLGADLSSYYTKEEVDTLLSAPSLASHPVGSIYQSTSSTSPASLFGGTWEKVASERVLMGVSSAHKAGTTADAGLPNITGVVDAVLKPRGKDTKTAGVFALGATASGRIDYGDSFEYYFYPADFNASRSSAVYGKSTTVQPAAYYVYIWRRTA